MAETLLVLKVLDGGLEEVAPLLVVGPARLQAPAAPRHAVAARAVPQRFLIKYNSGYSTYNIYNE